MTIYLHIGLNKTGTSSLQNSCDANRDLLALHGLVYPAAGNHFSAHYGVSKFLMGRPAADEVLPPVGLEEEIRAAVAGGKHVLLSSEYFFQATDDQVAAIHGFFAKFGTACKVIVYLRRHDLWLESQYNQDIKAASNLKAWHVDIRDYALHMVAGKHMEMSYAAILDRWAQQFGVEQMIVRPFESQQFSGGDLVSDFLGCIDPDLPASLARDGFRPVRANESISEHAARAIAYFKTADLTMQSRQQIAAILLRDEAWAGERKQKRRSWDTREFTFAPHSRRSILNLFAADYRYVAQRYMGSKDGILFRETLA